MGGYESLGWHEIVNEYRTVVLSEAGTGKTEELKHLTKKLRESDLPAFFIRLEDLAGEFEDAFEIGSYKEFISWIESENEGWLLLDSIDEARLSDPRDFERAIKKFLGNLLRCLTVCILFCREEHRHGVLKVTYLYAIISSH